MTRNFDLSDLTGDSLYKLVHWFSPSFPIGAYAYSRGLETAVESALVNTKEELVDWIISDLLNGPGWIDAVLFCHVFRAAVNSNEIELLELATLANALRGSSELALESSNQGEAFATTVSECWSLSQVDAIQRSLGGNDIRVALPVAAAASCAFSHIPLEQSLFFYVQAEVNNLVSAGIRLIPLGHSDGQRALLLLEETVHKTVEKAPTITLDNLGTSTPMIDLMSMAHETQYTRLFRS